MREPARNVQLAPIRGVEVELFVLQVGGRIPSQIDDDVEDGTFYASYKLGFGVRGELVVHPADCSAMSRE